MWQLEIQWFIDYNNDINEKKTRKYIIVGKISIHSYTAYNS